MIHKAILVLLLCLSAKLSYGQGNVSLRVKFAGIPDNDTLSRTMFQKEVTVETTDTGFVMISFNLTVVIPGKWEAKMYDCFCQGNAICPTAYPVLNKLPPGSPLFIDNISVKSRSGTISQIPPRKFIIR